MTTVETERINLQQMPNNGYRGPDDQYVELNMPKQLLKLLHGFKPFLEESTADQKLYFLKETSVAKPQRRVQKMLEKAQVS